MSGEQNKRVAAPGSDDNRDVSAESPSEEQESDDYTSSSGSSSEDDDQDDNEVQCSELQRKCEAASSPTKFRPDNALKSRLATFLPALERSNRELAASGGTHARKVDDVDDDTEQYVEMSLQLGILSERRPEDNDIKVTYESSDEENGKPTINSSGSHPQFDVARPNTTKSDKRKIEEV